MSYKYCERCGQYELFKGNLRYIDSVGKYICDDCLDKDFVRCEGCDDYWFNDHNMYQIDSNSVRDTGYCCPDCFNDVDEFNTCEECDELFHTDDLSYVNDDWVCRTCLDSEYTLCDFCQEFAHNDNILTDGYLSCCNNCINSDVTVCDTCDSFMTNEYYVHENKYYCQDCFFERFSFCDVCGETDYYQSMICHNDMLYCQYCADEEGFNGIDYDNLRIIYHYEFKPDAVFYGKNDDLHFGLELEVENVKKSISNHDMAEDLHDNYKHLFYCKEDDSITDGFEIVSHPMTWGWYKDNKKMFDTMLNSLSEQGFESYTPGTCGIHIHMSKKAFKSNLHFFKFMKLFYNNFDMIHAISQRTRGSSDGTCQWGNKSEYMDDKAMLHKTKYKHNSNADRYTMINLENDDTLEVRIFRGTLNKGSFHKNFEFLKACFEFTAVTGIKNINVKNFVKYVKKYRKTYKCLYNFMKDHNMLENFA